MISQSGNRGFLAAHYDWLVLAVGAVILAAGAVVYVSSIGEDADAAVAETVAGISRTKTSDEGIAGTDMTEFQSVLRQTRSPVGLTEVSEQTESFLASERRVLCKKCGKAICGDVKLCPQCPFCGEKQEVAAKVVLDADGDGLPDEWERKFGLNPNDAADANADLDGDGFTNAEEFQAKTDPKDRNDHPDYLDSLKIVLPLKETYMPFVFLAANKIPDNWRCEFFDAKQKDDYGRLGRSMTAVIGEEIGKSGFILRGYEKKSTKRNIKGSVNQKEVDVSEVKVERKQDGKTLTLVIAESKKTKPMPVDVQATLSYERGTSQNFDVVAGSEIVLNGAKYRIAEIKPAAKGARIVIENLTSGKKRTLEALEP